MHICTNEPTGTTLDQVMACCLFGVRPLTEPILTFLNSTLRNKFKRNMNHSSKLLLTIHFKMSTQCRFKGNMLQQTILKHNILVLHRIPLHFTCVPQLMRIMQISHVKRTFSFSLNSILTERQTLSILFQMNVYRLKMIWTYERLNTNLSKLWYLCWLWGNGWNCSYFRAML